jgi:predicted RND superfamily exporter protein
MKSILYRIINKWPIKVISIALVVVAVLAFFITNISLSTGNETLIESDTSTYQDNLKYQETFGSDPIMIIFEMESVNSLFSYDSLFIINNLVKNLEGMDGIFFINSPIGIIETATEVGYENYQNGLYELSNGLLSLSESMSDISIVDSGLDSETLFETFNTLSGAQDDLNLTSLDQVATFEAMKLNVSNEILRLEGIQSVLDPIIDQTEYQSIEQTMQILTNINQLYEQLIIMNTQLASGSSMTSDALNQISLQLSTLFTTVSGVQDNVMFIANNLEIMGNTLASMAQNFNMFTGKFPSSSDTLETMIYPNGELNPLMSKFVIDDTHMYINIILEESTSNEEISAIIERIENNLEETIYEDSLVSGKPVLNFDIQESMMSSMQIMMVTAVIIMVIVLIILFPVKARLLPLIIVFIAVLTTIGIMGLFSIPLTMVSMAVFPVLIGLGIDYSIQFHSRYMEELLEVE